jgi:hypothetical protein
MAIVSQETITVPDLAGARYKREGQKLSRNRLQNNSGTTLSQKQFVFLPARNVGHMGVSLQAKWLQK